MRIIGSLYHFREDLEKLMIGGPCCHLGTVGFINPVPIDVMEFEEGIIFFEYVAKDSKVKRNRDQALFAA